jgi:purine-binding chemotaxis protein CheW
MTGQTMVDEIESEEVERDQYLVFQVKEQEFGIQAMWIQEISRPLNVTSVPDAPPYIDGVANLRGRLSTVINFRKKFGFDEKENDEDTRLIVIEHRGFPLGLLVDAVEEVIRIPDDLVKLLPEGTSSMTQEALITGIGMLNNRIIIMLDINKVLGKTTLVEPEVIKQAIAEMQNKEKENDLSSKNREERHGEDLDRG